MEHKGGAAEDKAEETGIDIAAKAKKKDLGPAVACQPRFATSARTGKAAELMQRMRKKTE
jgi:hypothetical protein